MWRVKVYFPDTTDLNDMVAVIDRMLACKGYIESKLGKPAAVGVDRPTEARVRGFEGIDDAFGKIESAAKRVLFLDGQVARLGELVDIMEQRVKMAESKAEDIDLGTIPISKAEGEKEGRKSESEKA